MERRNPPTWNADAGYIQLAMDSVLPIFAALDQGDRDADALLSAAFSPLVHAVLDYTLDAGAPGLHDFLTGLVRPPSPESTTCWLSPGAAWTTLVERPQPPQVAAAFDLRPGGGPELAAFPYVPLVDRAERIPCFYRELVPSVVAVLRGWGATLIVVPSYRQPLAADQALWAAITAPLPPARR
jgi:hypothetical protein